MKTFKIILITVLAVILMLSATAYYFYNRGVNDTLENHKSLIDSVNAISYIESDTVIISDTFYIEKIVYQEIYKPSPDIVKGDTAYYNDTISNEDLEFWIKEQIAGNILSRSTGYKLKAPTLIRDTVRIFKPIPRIITEYKDCDKIEYKAYLSGEIGFNYYSVGYHKIIKKRHSIGLNTVIFEGQPTISIGYSYFFD